MLYVFHVDMGRMLKFDMNVAVSSVSNLKDTIERLHGIPAQNIVLLVSGGEMLTKSTQVSFYSAGTDTNPIYMFLVGDVKLPSLMPAIETDVDLKDQVEHCLTLPAVYDTVVTRAHLAQQMYELAREEEAVCERLVHEQHLQQQGWSAVVANMEDLTNEFRQRFVNFCYAFMEHLEKRERYVELLNNFSEDLAKLSQIPILPGLMQLAQEDFHGFDKFLVTEEGFLRSGQAESVVMAENAGSSTAEQSESYDLAEDDKRESTSPNKKPKMGSDDEKSNSTKSISSIIGGAKRTLTLLQWISAEENHDRLIQMSDECIQSLKAFDDDIYNRLKEEITNVIRSADQTDMKEVKGLSDRLCKLEEIKYKIKNMVQDQRELSTAFQQNHTRAINLRDASILPDLCASHKSQLLVMLNNHQKIRDLRRCISKAKDELGTNLHTRLKRIVLLENKMSEFDNQQLFYHRCIKRADRHIHIIDQIHQAPCVYVAAVAEVVRRKIFSDEFGQWASKLAEDFNSIHREEMGRRHMFNLSFEGHFLNILFPGMSDMPPAFATANPLIFDSRLPNITKADLDVLTSFLPDLAQHFQLPDMTRVIKFFSARPASLQDEQDKSLPDEKGKSLPPDVCPTEEHQQPDLKVTCEESELDTDEFEKVMRLDVSRTANSPKTVTVDAETSMEAPQTETVETITEENFDSNRLEIERLKTTLKSLSELSAECIKLARSNLQEIRTDQNNYQGDFRSEIQTVSDKWQVIQMRCESRERDITGLAISYRTKINELEELVRRKEEDIRKLRTEQVEMEENHVLQVEASNVELQDKYAQLEKQLEAVRESLGKANEDKLRAVAEVREKLTQEFKTEIESLRCRYKLMTSIERSPSDTSLEKIERTPEMLEYGQHELIISKIREQCHAEKEKAVKQAIELERMKWQPKKSMSDEDMDIDGNILKMMLQEKDKYIEMLKERVNVLDKDNLDLKMQISSLTNDEMSSWVRENMEIVNREKDRTASEDRFSLDLSTSTIERPRSSRGNQRCAVLESCSKGDIVFVVWSKLHSQYMVVQDSPFLYFVHGDSLNALNLKTPEPGELEGAATFYALGKIIEKDYCQARKAENRYKVSKGSKFYRIKLAPLSRNDFKSCRHDRHDTSSISSTPLGNRSLSQSKSCNSPLTNFNQKPRVTTDNSSNLVVQKKRTTSVASITEDDEHIALLTERCRGISVSEEEPTKQSVITEQPTASNISSMENVSACFPVSAYKAEFAPAFHLLPTNSDIQNPIIANIGGGAMEKDTDESDEYRSLETKDDNEFPSMS